MIALYILIGLVIAAAVGLLVYAVATHSKRADKGFVNGLKPWDRSRIPIGLLFGHELSPRMRDTFRQAVEFWENQTKVSLFNSASDHKAAGALVPVHFHDTEGEYFDHLGATIATTTCYGGCTRIAFARVRMNIHGKIVSASMHLNMEQVNALNDKRVFRSIAHEMGHLVGLAHDDLRHSVMYAKAIDGQPIVTAMDREIIRENYGPQKNS